MAAPARRIKADCVAGLDVFNLVADFGDDTGAVPSQDMGKGQLHAGKTAAIPNIDVIQRRGFELDYGVALAQ
jgi:hypothetical protein